MKKSQKKIGKTEREMKQKREQTNDTETRVTKLRNFWACQPHLFQRLFQSKKKKSCFVSFR
jgi:hypothetical protein